MKKLLLFTALAVIALTKTNAQEFKASLNTGYPFGSVGEKFSLLTELDVAYTFEVSEPLEIGATAGYGRFFGKNIPNDESQRDFQFEGSDFGYIPIAATAKYSFGRYQVWFGGLDLGYAIALGDDSLKDLAGINYMTKFGWQNQLIEVFAYYKGIGSSETQSSTSGNLTTSVTYASLGTAGLGFAYKF